MKRASCLLAFFLPILVIAQAENFSAVQTKVYFDHLLREWDGFGFNYVETAQTTDYSQDPQEYGGFSLLDDQQKGEIIEMIFGKEGLKVGLVKMFHDPWHQPGPEAAFDHKTTTAHMREFVRKGVAKTRENGRELQIISTLYGPPAWATKQKFLRGRDFDPAMKEALGTYIVDWVRFLREEEGFPLRYYSLHNEGEDWWRWPEDGRTGNIGEGHDYNMYWPPELVVAFVSYMRNRFDEAGLSQVGITNGEPTNWFRFSSWGYAQALYENDIALNQLGLVSSHGFYSGGYRNRWFGPHTSEGIDLLRSKRPNLKAWVTSTSWSKMDAKNIKEMHGNIYTAKVNAIIPWAGIQRPPMWVGGDPNPGSAFTVKEDGTYEVRRGYYFYKQISRAGQPGMAVAQTSSMDSEVAVIAFDANGTDNPDAFLLVNWSNQAKQVSVEIRGADYARFEAFRTTEDESDLYSPLGLYRLTNGKLLIETPAGSVTTFFGK